ncbi:MAG: DUF3131 domain-containing protein [Pseudomonadota bacterium]
MTRSSGPSVQSTSWPRAPFVFAGGLILAAGVASWTDSALVRLSLGQGQIDLASTTIVVPDKAPLTDREIAAARAAWRYIEGNTQAGTGLVNSVDGFASTTLWDQGSYILSLVAAARLGLVDTAELDRRAVAFIDGLTRLELYDGRLPNKVYDTQTLRMVDYANTEVVGGIGWSALDIARLLMGLRVLEKHYPQHGPAIRTALGDWDLAAMADRGELMGAEAHADGPRMVQEGRIGYEQYGARAAALWGLDVLRAMSADRIIEWARVDGVDVPRDARRAAGFGAITPTVSEPYMLLALELGFDAESATLAQAVLQAQERRFEETGHITMVSEDHLDEAPHFAYAGVIANGRPWGVVTEAGTFHDDMRTQSVKASFAWDAIAGSAYTRQAREAVIDLADPERGFPAGIYESDGRVNEIYTLNTNAIILEALHFQVFGPLWSVR